MLADAPFRWTDPSTWPWIVYVWIAMLLLGWIKPLWKWFRRRQATGWPTAQGRIESVSVQPKKQRFVSTRGGRSAGFTAELAYSYSVQGQYYAGRFAQEFPTEAEAAEFVRDLQGKSVLVSYNPDKPANSTLSRDALRTLLDTRPPAPEGSFVPTLANVPGWVKPLLWPCIAFAAVGLGLSLWVHLGAVAGQKVAPSALFYGLHVGAIAIWFPAVFVAQRRVGSLNRKSFWKLVLRDAPEWMRYMVYLFLAYAMINFAIFFSQQGSQGGSGANPPALVWRGFSGHWMAFYSAALAIMYSAAAAPTDTAGSSRALRP